MILNKCNSNQKFKIRILGLSLKILLANFLPVANSYAADFYFSVGQGLTASEKASLSHNQHFQNRVQSKGKSKATHEHRVAVGQKIKPFRLELEGSFYKSHFLNKNIKERISVMGNVYYDFEGLNETIYPFIGAGIGVSNIKNIFNDNYSTIKQTENRFSFQGISGVQLNLSSEISVSLDYRYFATQKLKSQEGRHKVKSLNLGITFRF